VANRSVSDYARVLNPGGTYVACAFNATSLFLGPVISRSSGKKIVSLIHKQNVADLLVLKELFETGKVVSIIDDCYPLNELPAAVRHFDEGNARGKIVITM
jgi:D-arabinose 1-dehydrogenase-like Zn-dependent alcohol dehydrogenase